MAFASGAEIRVTHENILCQCPPRARSLRLGADCRETGRDTGRAGSAYQQHKLRGELFCPIIDWIMYHAGAYPYPRGHCIHAIEGDVLRAKAVIADQSKSIETHT